MPSGTEVASLFGVLDLQDNASGALKTARGALGGFADGLKSTGGDLMKFGGALTLATAPLTAFFVTSIKQAEESQDALRQLSAVIKSTGGVAGVTAKSANDLADSLSKVTRFSDDAILSGENMLLTFTNIGKDVFPDATKTVLDMSQALGQDLKSSAIQLGKALNDPVKGISALSRVGVTFTQAQKDQIKAMVAAGNTMGAQKIILAELRREFGDSAEMAGTTFAGRMDILTHRFEDFQEKIGYMLMPVLEQLMDTIGGVIDSVTAWTDANPQLAQTVLMIAGALTVLGPVLIVVGGVISAIGTLIPIVAGAFALLTGPIGLVIVAFAALKRAYDTNFLGFKDTVDKIVAQLEIFVNALPVYLNTVVFYFEYYFKQIWDKVKPTIDQLGVLIPYVLNQVSTTAQQLGLIITTVLLQVSTTAAQLVFVIVATLTAASTAAGQLIVIVKTYMATVYNWIVNNIVLPLQQVFNSLPESLRKAMADMVSQIAQFIIQNQGFFSLLPNGGQFISVAHQIIDGTRDSGGRGSAGKAYAIGVGAQPEVFVPDSAGTFYPNADKMGSGGGGLHIGTVIVQGDTGHRSDEEVIALSYVGMRRFYAEIAGVH